MAASTPVNLVVASSEQVRVGVSASAPMGALENVSTAFVVGTQGSGRVRNSGTVPMDWTLIAATGMTATPSSGAGLAAGAYTDFALSAVSAGVRQLSLVIAGGSVSGGSPVDVTASDPVAPGVFPIPPLSGGLVAVELRPTATLTAPVAIAQAFRQGDVPSGANLAGVQMTVLNRWPDNSVRLGLLAFGCPVSGTTPRQVALQIGTGPTAALAAVTASFTAGSFGSAAFGPTEWASPFVTWVSGPLMSSWIFRKPIGIDAHLVAWMEVRAFIDGSVEVLPWMENGYLRVAGPTSKSATYTFTLNGTQRFSGAINLKHHQRTPLISGTVLSFWTGTDPGVTPIHDAAYLQATELVPPYYGTVAADAYAITGVGTPHPGLPTSFQPLQQGVYWFGGNGYPPDSMPNPSYQTPLGLIPQWDVLHLTAATVARTATYNSVIWQGYSAGRYGIHYRDETTNRPAAFSAYPNLGIYDDGSLKDTGGNSTTTPATSGGNPPTWDPAHSPSVGFMAYLLTGRFYFKEEVQFAAVANHLNVTDWIRGGGYGSATPWPGYSGASGLCVSYPQTRTGAWWFRTLAQALAVTPDAGDPLKAEFVASVEANCNFFHSIYVAQANNAFGFIEGGGSYAPGTGGYIPGAYSEPIWEQDFGTAAWGYALAMGLPISGAALAKMQAFFAWKAQSIVGRLGPMSGGYPYVNAAPYALPIAPSTSADFRGGTGPWYASWAAVYSALTTTSGSEPVSLGGVGTTDGVLSLTEFPSAAQPNMWHNLQPAIAYAVRHGVSGALAAYSRMVGASNWSQIRTVWDTKPVWGVKPARGLVPDYMASKAVGEWFELPNTLVPREQFDFCSIAVRDEGDGIVELASVAPGGHGGNLTNNQVKRLRLERDTPGPWDTLRAADNATGYNTTGGASAYLPGGQPAPRHLYPSAQWNQLLGRYVIGGRYWGSGAADWWKIDGFNPANGTWDPAGTYPDAPHSSSGDGQFSCRNPLNGDIYSTGSDTFSRLNPATMAVTQIGAGFAANSIARYGNAFDTQRGRIFHLSAGDNFNAGGAIHKAVINVTTGLATAVSFTSSAAQAEMEAALAGEVLTQPVYDAQRDKFYLYLGLSGSLAKVYEITPNSGTTGWTVAVIAGTGSAPPRITVGGVGFHTFYLPTLRAFGVAPPDANVFLMRMSLP
jgi:hypothetical protein